MKRAFAGIFSLAFILSFSQKKWTLQEAVDYAVQNNHQVIANSYNKQLQDKNLEIARRQKLPSVSGSVSNNFSFGQQRYINVTQRNDNFTNSANVGADILLYNNGRLEKMYRKTEFEVEAAKYDVESIKNNISLQIAQEYLSALLNKEIVTINKSAVDNAERLYKRAKITTEVGTTPQTILAEAEAALAREKQNLKASEINVNRSLFSLAQLLQLPDYKDFDIEDVPLQNNIEAPLYAADAIMNTAYQQQPQIKAAENRIKAAEAQTEITKTAFFPTITGNAGLQTNYFNPFNANNNGFFKQYADNFGQYAGVSANIPIFNKGITRIQVEQAKINEDAARTSLLQQKQEIRQNVQKAQFDAESNYENYLAAVEAEKSSALALDFAEKSYAAGRTTIYDLNAARNNHASAKGAVAQAKYNYLFSLKLLNFYAGIPLSL
ncbi:Outer membrane efflux protein BepC precursor [Chryseobacterium taklimakanense]|uniref:Outer membrane efflux protein BepC n=1 Tax=Chryseobacterium taklimakanense TaxID=536441 RepID=A0A239XKD5_9FLAO|nr:TolC family protein [Chryseobacterium taklimakanense]SNV47195.1 Outer membrane efflux protein BepC precursor [Chryseobacterium taklimakanense]